MAKIQVKQTVKAQREEVFATWNDFGNIYKFHPGLKHSRLINQSQNGGLGAQRQCNLKDGKNWLKEKVTTFVPNQRMVIDIYQSSMPLKSARAELDFRSVGENTEVSFTIHFTPGMGPFGYLMLPMMKMQFKGMIRDMLKSNAEFVESGKQANPTLIHAA